MKKFTNRVENSPNLKQPDHRTQVTKLLLRRAFTGLLKQKPIQSISVKELCAVAGINRGTFYSHYRDIYDLLEQLEQEMLEDFKKALEPLFAQDVKRLAPVKITAEVFRCLKENADLCVVTLGDNGDKVFAMKLLSLGRQWCVDTYSRYFEKATPKQIEYFYAFASSGCIGLLQKWLSDGMTDSVEEIASMAENIMLNGLGCLQQQ